MDEALVVLDVFDGVGDAFSFGLLDGGGSGSDNCHGGGLLVRESLVSHLDMVHVVIDGFIRLLVEVGKVGASHFC